MTHKQIIEATANNRTAKYILRETQNLANTFNFPDGTDELPTGQYNGVTTYMTDTIENLYFCFCDLIGLPEKLSLDSEIEEFILTSIDISKL